MPKRRRYNGRRKQPKNSVDRIFNLPIEIIRQIHSCLPRIDAVKTSILSKKWQSIWASHPRILLDEIDFGADYSRYSVTDKPKRDAFLTYLRKFLEIRERPSEYNCYVDKLFLRMTVENSSAELLLWIQETEMLRTIVVSNPNLEFFGVQLLCSDDGYSNLCEVEITSKPTVRSLTLCNINDEDSTLFDMDDKDMTMTWMNFIDKFPLLEELIIDDCSRLQKLHISQPNLASLVLKDSIVRWEVRIDSPKLKSLEYKGGLTYFKGIEDLQELEFVLLYLDPFKLRDYWYNWFRDILESCAHSKRLSLICDIEEVVLIPVEVTDILPINDIKNLELEIISRHGTFQVVVDDFTWILPDLKTLSLTLGSTTKFFEVESVFPMFLFVSVIVFDELHIYYIANAVFVERNDVKVVSAERLKLRDWRSSATVIAKQLFHDLVNHYGAGSLF
ncbi:hypothetical protein KY284_031821 [Solanum tuberosum]|nr:hypothetical protein KY284_031821 [Solanum tuberosum]